MLFFAGPVLAWPGHAWEQWRKETTWRKADLPSDQAGRKDLAALLEIGPDRKAIDSIAGWEQKRARIAAVLSQLMGEPNRLEPPAPEAEILGEEVLADHVRRRVRIRTEPDDWMPAYVLLPKELPATASPVMICLHQTVAQGKDEPCGIRGSPDLAFALQLVRRGYVCVAPDVIGFGERIPPGGQPYHDSAAFYRRHPKWSYFGKMNWDVARLIDYLETQPFADRLQIGCIGHSHGAYGALMAAAFEPRVSLVIASCGFTTLRADPSPHRWSHLTALLPQLGEYLPEVSAIPFDWQEVCALIAPRPLYVWYATRDDIFPKTGNLEALFQDVRRVYGLYGAADDLAWQAFDGGHSFPAQARERAYSWLAERFFRVGDLRAPVTDLPEWQERRALTRRVILRTIGSPAAAPPPPEAKVLLVERFEGYDRQLIEYAVEKSERVRAYLCRPREGRAPRPGVLVLHQTTAEGKREAVGLAGEKALAFGADLAERGYVTLSPDSITAGERIDRFGPFDTRGHYQRHPDLSALGKMLWDARRGLDVLAAADGVDPKRLAAIGHSLGAEEALLLAAFDERVVAAVASCGYTPFRYEPERLRWARDHWFSYCPKLRPVFATGRLPHWDWDDAVRLIAPRGLYHYNTRDDQIFKESERAFDAAEAARPIWRLTGRPDGLVNVLDPGQHEVSPSAKSRMYAWLDQRLAPAPPAGR
ncbi:MAG: hypothetical protein AMXMBFR83_18920 [Phycisphaerae bacterium]